MPTISAVIITLNEARNIARCIRSLEEVADEVIVGDSGSTDDTLTIAESLGARVLQLQWQGYSETKNALNAQASQDYILSIDADEALSKDLAKEILNIKNSLSGAYSLPRLTNYCGKWVRHGGWYPDTKIRLWPKDAAHWEGSIHEALILKEGTAVTPLQHDLLHYSIHTKADHIATIREYARLQAAEMLARKKKGMGWKRWLSPIARFISMYLLKLGFLDGGAGWQIARLSAWGVYLKYTLALQDARRTA